MGVAETSPSVPQRDGEGTYKLVRELAPIASKGPKLGVSTHGYTSWGAPNADDARYVRVAPPRPAGILLMLAETNTPHAGRSCVKNLAGAPTLLQGFEGYTRGAAGGERPISKRQHLRYPSG
jgi:hypothetical protein